MNNGAIVPFTLRSRLSCLFSAEPVSPARGHASYLNCTVPRRV
jgi:hypothetical protein